MGNQVLNSLMPSVPTLANMCRPVCNSGYQKKVKIKTEFLDREHEAKTVNRTDASVPDKRGTMRGL